MPTVEEKRAMKSRIFLGFVIGSVLLASFVLWLGCEQKGTLSPTSTGQGQLFYFDTVRVTRSALAPTDQLDIEAHVLSESSQDAVGQAVRYTANRGNFLNGTADTSVSTDANGWASATYVAPEDTGNVTLRAELVSMSEMVTRMISVTTSGQPLEGLLYLWSESDTLFSDNGQSSVKLHARLRNSNNNPIGGVLVYFSANLGTIGSPIVTDSATGVATSTLYSGTMPGTAHVYASYGTTRDSVDVVFVEPYPAASVAVNALPPQITAGLDSATIRAVVYNAQGGTVTDNTLVLFSADRGTLSSMQGRTVSGVVTVKLYAPPITGLARVTANVGAGVSGYTDVNVLPGALATIIMIPQSDSLYADNFSTTKIDVYAEDSFGNPASEGTPISFTATEGTITQSATVDAEGHVQVIYQAGLTAGPAAITASNTTIQNSISIYLMPTPAANISLSVMPVQLPADGSSNAQLTALVLDAESRPVSDGTIVAFTSNLGVLGGGATTLQVPGWAPVERPKNRRTERTVHTLSGSGSRMSRGPVRPGDDPIASVYATTTTNGYAYATLTASTTAGIDTIAASVTGLSDTKYVTYTPGQAAQVAVEPGLSSLPADGISTTPVTIRVQDAYGNLVGAGATVSVEASLGMVSPNQGHTNTQSVFTTTLQTERITGLSAITARSGSAVGYGEVEFVAPNVAAISVQADETSILADGTALTTLRALVVDGSGVPVFGVPVTWEAGTGIGTVTTTLSVTDSMGMALSGFRSGASSTNVSQQVTASASGFEDDVSILMRGVTINVSAQNPMIPADGETTTAVRAHVYETTSHIGLADVSVIFATTLGSIPRTELTNSSGVATVMLQASPSAGLADITAQYGDTLRAITQVSMVSTQGEVITLTPGTSTLLGNGLTSTPLYIYVVDDGGWPSEGEVVTLSIVSGTGMVTPSVVLTNSYGTATATYTSAAVMEDTQTEVEALIERANTTTWISLQGVTLTCAAVPQMIVADGHSTSQIRVQLYQTTTTIAIEGAQIFFGTNLGSVPNQAVTNSSGIATVTLTSGTITGSARVVAGYGVGLIDTVNVSFAESTPTNLNLTANPSIILADNVSTSIISAMITDQGGNPVPDGTQIHFDIPPNSGSLENLRTTTNGVATSILTSSTTPDTVEILAWAGANPSARDSVDIIYTVGPPTVVLLSAQSDTLKADGISVDTIYATVKDAVGHRLPNVEVQFETTIGNIPGSRTTDENGTVRIPFSSPTTGTAQITATAGTGVAYYTVYLVPGCPWSVGMEYNPHSVGVKESGRNETLLITATIKDASNNPVIDGTPVWFDIYSQPITHPDSMGSLSSVDSIPTINGRASVSYSSGFRSGTVRIRARSNGICEGESYNVSAITTEIIIYSGPPYIEDIYNPDGCGYFNTSHIKVASSPCDLVGWSAVGDSVMITAIVGDKWNNPVPEGTAVYFTTSGGVITTATGYTNANGFATVTLFGGNPMPTLSRWWNTLEDPNLGGQINCWGAPDRDGIAKVLVTAEGETQNNQSAIVWATCGVRFTAPYDGIRILEMTVNGDPNERTLYIGENALILYELWEGGNHWPIDSESIVRFSASAGAAYPSRFTIGCPGDTLYTVSFFNNLTTQDDATATPVMIEVESKNGNLWTFTETFLLLPQLASEPPNPDGEGRVER